MERYDKVLRCEECHGEFCFTAGEQEFYEKHGLQHEPKRCKDCRAGRGRSGIGTPIVCAQCGKETTVPFKPKNTTPLYCQDCLRQRVRFLRGEPQWESQPRNQSL
jgi:CxxC-x17-CxxC domain-containing protein